jgi:serine/threonine protein kinase
MGDETTRLGDSQTALKAGGGVRIAKGESIGRLIVLEQVGEGGMGLVYAAYDTALDRRVCIKFLKQIEDEGSRHADSRLISEARALAQISHPHILPVYDVGQFEDQVYLVTEFVDGWTLSEWVSGHDPDSQRILAVYQDAGRGLAAAHAAGIVHRDFKPDNVMLGRDGRVRVMDFGLAASELAHESLSDGYGTPRFMAPEQLQGDAATAASDQFTFALSLCTSLGAHPDLLRNDPGSLAQLPVDEAQRVALGRALAPEPQSRFADMAALLDALSPSIPRRSRWLALMIGLATVVGASFSGYQLSQSPAPCLPQSAPSLAWSLQQRPAMRQAFIATGLPYAGSAFDKLTPIVDRYLQQWTDQRVSACEATHVRHVQSSELLDRRMVCLDRSLRQVDALGRLFAAADAAIVNESMRAVSSLPNLSNCADQQSLLNQSPLPAGPQGRQIFERLDHGFAAAWADHTAGRYASALEKLEAIEADVNDFEHMPTQARHALLKGTVQNELANRSPAESSLDRAVFLALLGGDLGVATDAATALAYYYSQSAAPDERVESWYERAKTLATTLDDPARLAKLSGEYGQHLILETGPSDQAIDHLAFLLSEYTRIYGADSPRTANAMRGYAWVLYKSGRMEEALEYSAQALGRIEASFGVHHNSYLAAANNHASMLTDAHRPEEALALLQKASNAGIENLGEEHPMVLLLIYTWAYTLSEQDRCVQALPRYQQVLEVAERSLGKQHRIYGGAANGVGACLRELGQLEPSRAILRDTLESHGQDYLPEFRALLAFNLAQTLALIGEDQRRILELIDQALLDMPETMDEWRAEVAEFAARQRVRQNR